MATHGLRINGFLIGFEHDVHAFGDYLTWEEFDVWMEHMHAEGERGLPLPRLLEQREFTAANKAKAAHIHPNQAAR